MTERNLIHVGGSPGSGKSRMSRALVDRLHETTDLHAEHISIGDQVRLLARGAINATPAEREHVILHLANPLTAVRPLDEEIISKLLHLSLDSAAERNIDTIFLDGYPRYEDQVDSYFYWAQMLEYDTPGALIAEVDIETAQTRIQKRGRDHHDRYTNALLSWDKIIEHNENYPVALRKLSAFSIWFSIHRINTSGPKELTDDRAFEATKQLIGEPLPKSA